MARILSPLRLPNFAIRPKTMNKPCSKYDFITDLKFGTDSEKTIANILGLDGKEFEVKTERNWWAKTGNIAIEIECNKKPSGINVTEAKYWVHVFQDEGKLFSLVILPVKVLKKIVKNLLKAGFKTRMVGDGYRSKCLIVKKEILLNHGAFKNENMEDHIQKS